MNDTVMTVIAIFLAAILMFMFPLMSTADRSDDIAQQAVQTATTEFVDDIRTTGKITQDKYDSFLQTISSTGNSFDVEMQVEILDENANKKTTQASSSKVGENYMYTEYTSQITVKNTNKTISQVLKNFMYRVTGNGNYNIAAQHSGIVNVNAK